MKVEQPSDSVVISIENSSNPPKLERKFSLTNLKKNIEETGRKGLSTLSSLASAAASEFNSKVKPFFEQKTSLLPFTNSDTKTTPPPLVSIEVQSIPIEPKTPEQQGDPTVLEKNTPPSSNPPEIVIEKEPIDPSEVNESNESSEAESTDTNSTGVTGSTKSPRGCYGYIKCWFCKIGQDLQDFFMSIIQFFKAIFGCR